MAGYLSNPNLWANGLNALGAGLLTMGAPTSQRAQVGQQAFANFQQMLESQRAQRDRDFLLNRQISEDARQYARQQKEDQDRLQQQAAQDAAISQLPPELQQYAKAYPQLGAEYVQNQFFPKPQTPPASVAEYEYAKQHGYTGSLLEYEKEKAAAGRAPATPRQPGIVTLYSPQGESRAFFDTDPQIKGFLDKGWIDNAPKSEGILITNPDGTTTQIGGPQKAKTAADQASNLRSSMIEDAIAEFDTIDFNKVRAPMVVANESTAKSPIFNSFVQANLNSDEKKLLSNQAKIQEATISAITGAAYSDEQKQNMRAAYVPLPTDTADERIRKLKDAAKFLKQLNANTGRTPSEQPGVIEYVRDPVTKKLVPKAP